MNKEDLNKRLIEEGFIHIYEWHDEPGAEYAAHAHKGKVSLCILHGDLTFWFGDEEVVLREGDRFDVPIGKQHTAKIGYMGCDFLVGEAIEGDS